MCKGIGSTQFYGIYIAKTMFQSKKNKRFTGIDIDSSSVHFASIEREKTGWRVLQHGSFPFSPDVLKLAYKKPNIQDQEKFKNVIGKALDLADPNAATIGLSLPNEVVKTTLHRFNELPGTKADIEKMIAWTARKTHNFPEEEIKLSYHVAGKNQKGDNILIVTNGLKEVLNEYELLFQELGKTVSIIRPTGINQLNFFIQQLPNTGHIAYLGLFQNSFTFFVFENAQLIFLHVAKKDFSNPHFFQDIDMAKLHYRNENPDHEIEALYVGSQLGFPKGVDTFLEDLGIPQTHLLNENEVVVTESFDIEEPISPCISAIAVAQDLGEV